MTCEYNNMYDINELLNIVNAAIEKFNTTETYLLDNDLSERCICARFAFYLQNEINGSRYRNYVVDVEYNRGFEGREIAPKRLYDGHNILVDLIVHKRGYNEITGFDNLICIEMKKSTNKHGCGDDEQRLKDLASYNYGYLYKLGLMLVADIANKRLYIKNKFFLNDVV